MKDDNFLIEETLKTLQNPDILSAHLSAMSQLCDFIVRQKVPLDIDSQATFALNVKLMCSSIAKLREATHLLLAATETNTHSFPT